MEKGQQKRTAAAIDGHVRNAFVLGTGVCEWNEELRKDGVFASVLRAD